MKHVTWIVPAALLAFAGAAKIIAPTGVVPRGFEELDYALVQRALGGIELAVAAALAWPRTRGPARVACVVLLASFSLFVAWHAHDRYFVANCGCFGAAGVARQWPIEDYGLILLRNALLCGLVVAVRPRVAVFVAPVLALGTLFLAETRVRMETGRLVDAIAQGRRRARLPGWKLPPLDLLDEHGRRTSVAAAFQPRDHLVFFAVDCPHCHRMGAAWAAFADEIATRGARVVLVATQPGGDVAAFKRSAGCAALPHVVMRDPKESYAIGIGDVPQLVVLGDDLRVAYHAGQLAGDTFSGAVRTAGVGDAAWKLVAAALFGDDATLDAAPRWKDGIGIADVGEGRRLVVVRAAAVPSHVLELAIGLDASRRVLGVVVLTAAGYSRVVDPDASFVQEVAGLALEDAVKKASDLARRPAMNAALWRSVELMLRDLAQFLPPT